MQNCRFLECDKQHVVLNKLESTCTDWFFQLTFHELNPNCQQNIDVSRFPWYYSLYLKLCTWLNPRAPQDKLNSQRREKIYWYNRIRRKSAATTHCTLQVKSYHIVEKANISFDIMPFPKFRNLVIFQRKVGNIDANKNEWRILLSFLAESYNPSRISQRMRIN